MNKIKKVPWSTIYLGVTILALVVIGFANNQLFESFASLKNMSGVDIFLAGGVQIAFVAVEALIIFFLLRTMGDNINYGSCAKVGIVGLYYCAITPSATGGQPAQVAYLKRDNGINVANSVATLSLKFFTYQVALVSLGIVSLVFMYDKLMLHTPTLIPIAIGGLCVNSVWIIVFLPMLYSKTFLIKLCKFLRKLIQIFKFIKKKEKYTNSVNKFEEDFAIYSQKYREKKRVVFYSILLSIPELILQMSVLFFVFRAFGNSNYSFFEITSLQFLLQASVSFMPMPGAAGAQELGFTAFLGPYFPSEQIFAAIIIWRLFTYYSVVVVGAGVIVVDEIFQKRKRRKQMINL